MCGYTSFLLLNCRSHLSSATLQRQANQSDHWANASSRTAWLLFCRNNWWSRDQTNLNFQVVFFMLTSLSIARGRSFICFKKQDGDPDSSFPVLLYFWPAWPSVGIWVCHPWRGLTFWNGCQISSVSQANICDKRNRILFSDELRK